jgi:hypothetical protein
MLFFTGKKKERKKGRNGGRERERTARIQTFRALVIASFS